MQAEVFTVRDLFLIYILLYAHVQEKSPRVYLKIRRYALGESTSEYYCSIIAVEYWVVELSRVSAGEMMAGALAYKRCYKLHDHELRVRIRCGRGKS